MRLGDYVQSLPHGERKAFRQKLATAHNCSVSLVRKWENWPAPPCWSAEKVISMSRKHPADAAAFRITEEMTGHQVSRQDLRPECWSEE